MPPRKARQTAGSKRQRLDAESNHVAAEATAPVSSGEMSLLRKELKATKEKLAVAEKLIQGIKATVNCPVFYEPMETPIVLKNCGHLLSLKAFLGLQDQAAIDAKDPLSDEDEETERKKSKSVVCPVCRKTSPCVASQHAICINMRDIVHLLYPGIAVDSPERKRPALPERPYLRHVAEPCTLAHVLIAAAPTMDHYEQACREENTWAQYVITRLINPRLVLAVNDTHISKVGRLKDDYFSTVVPGSIPDGYVEALKTALKDIYPGVYVYANYRTETESTIFNIQGINLFAARAHLSRSLSGDASRPIVVYGNSSGDDKDQTTTNQKPVPKDTADAFLVSKAIEAATQSMKRNIEKAIEAVTETAKDKAILALVEARRILVDQPATTGKSLSSAP